MRGRAIGISAGGDPPTPGGPIGPGTPTVELFGHAECCLCRTAVEVLERLRAELGFELVEHDIYASEALHRAYFERVPVVALDGEELFSFHVDEAVLRARLRGA